MLFSDSLGYDEVGFTRNYPVLETEEPVELILEPVENRCADTSCQLDTQKMFFHVCLVKLQIVSPVGPYDEQIAHHQKPKCPYEPEVARPAPYDNHRPNQ